MPIRSGAFRTTLVAARRAISTGSGGAAPRWLVVDPSCGGGPCAKPARAAGVVGRDETGYDLRSTRHQMADDWVELVVKPATGIDKLQNRSRYLLASQSLDVTI